MRLALGDELLTARRELWTPASFLLAHRAPPPTGTSVMNMAHWAQAVRKSRQSAATLFQKFDYGSQCMTARGLPRTCNQRWALLLGGRRLSCMRPGGGDLQVGASAPARQITKSQTISCLGCAGCMDPRSRLPTTSRPSTHL